MSEIINNSEKRKELLKHLIWQLHRGDAPSVVKNQLIGLLAQIPYGDVVEVEQQLIAEGLPEEEVLKFCDIHTAVLDGHISQDGSLPYPPGHPVDTFKKENIELTKVIERIRGLFAKAPALTQEEFIPYMISLKGAFNELSDVDKHYRRKEYLVFPFLEKNGITGPPKVMWGKHDETRQLLKSTHDFLDTRNANIPLNLMTAIVDVLEPAVAAVEGMIFKEEQILLPMCLDVLTEEDWYHIYEQTIEFGYCLYDPKEEWIPENRMVSDVNYSGKGSIKLPTGSFSTEELTALFSLLPMDITFVDKDDKVKFFSLGPHRIFDRNRAIIGRSVQLCHPPHSVHVVEQILNDFKSGKESNAAFWINFKGMFVYIEYIALRNEAGEYLGVIECTQDLTHYRSLEGEQRLLSYTTR